MAWQCSAKTNAGLAQNLLTAGLISARVHEALTLVDRRDYLPPLSRLWAYEDSPQTLGPQYGGATISAPHMHAEALEQLLPALGPGARVLDVGSGSGYLCHCFAALCPGGRVVGVDHLRGLVELARANMGRSGDGRERLGSGQVRFVLGDGREGYEDPELEGEELERARKGGFWDVIHVGAAAVEVHEPLVKQLRRKGRLFIPVEDEDGRGQSIWLYVKDEKGRMEKSRLMPVRYVPLTDAPEEEGEPGEGKGH